MHLKKGNSVPDDNHLIRRIPWNKLLKDEHNNVLGCLGEAFRLRDGEPSLSANRLEYFTGTQNDQIIHAVKELRGTFKIKPKDRFAIGKAVAIKAVCAEKNRKIRIISAPTKEIASHVSISSWPDDDMELLEIIAAEAWGQLVANSDIPT